MPLTFVLLALSICAVWLPSIRLGAKIDAPPWLVLLFGAMVSGLAQGYSIDQAGEHRRSSNTGDP